jgi:hypothetical protein
VQNVGAECGQHPVAGFWDTVIRHWFPLSPRISSRSGQLVPFEGLWSMEFVGLLVSYLVWLRVEVI